MPCVTARILAPRALLSAPPQVATQYDKAKYGDSLYFSAIFALTGGAACRAFEDPSVCAGTIGVTIIGRQNNMRVYVCVHTQLRPHLCSSHPSSVLLQERAPCRLTTHSWYPFPLGPHPADVGYHCPALRTASAMAAQGLTVRLMQLQMARPTNGCPLQRECI